MSGWDPSKNTQTIAALVARAYQGQFQITISGSSSQRDGCHPYQHAFPLDSGPFVVVTWTAVYRQRQLKGPPLVAPAALASYAEAAALVYARAIFDLWDMNLQALSDPQPNAYAPT